MSFILNSAPPGPSKLRALALAVMVWAGALSAPATAGAAAPAWSSEVFQAPTHLPPGGDGAIRIVTANVGDGPATAAPKISVALSQGVTAVAAPSSPWSCTGSTIVECVGASGAEEVIEPFTYTTVAGAPAPLVLPLSIAPDAAVGERDLQVTVSGGGAPAAIQHHVLRIGGEQLGFGPTPGSFRAAVLDAAGNAYTQAGGHPDSALFSFSYNTGLLALPPSGVGAGAAQVEVGAQGSPRDIVAELPAGLVIEPGGTPRCPNVGRVVARSCPPESQIGVVTISPPISSQGRLRMFAIYNLAPARGHPAEFAFQSPVGPVVLVPRLRSEGDYGLTASIRNLGQGDVLLAAGFSLWGIPGDPSHDPQRCPLPNSLARACVGYDELGMPPLIPGWGLPSDSGNARRPLLTTPTSCSQNLTSVLHLSQWGVEAPFQPSGAPDLSSSGWKSAFALTPTMRDCESLPFSPELGGWPTTAQAASPSGLHAELDLPQNQEPDALATAHLKDVRLVLPEGMAINPGFANGLGACPATDIGACPPASKIGSVEIETPILESPLSGSVFIARPWENPLGTRFAAYLVAEGDGVVVTLVAKIAPDPVDGQVSILVANSPQLPVTRVSLDLDGGPRAPFATPGCGVHGVAANVTSWAAPQTGLELRSPFPVVAGPTLGCPDGTLRPRFEAGLTSALAGGSSPFVLNLKREDGSGAFGGLEVAFPEGVVAKLKGIPVCPEAALAAAVDDGAATLPGICGASQVGRVVLGAGVGPRPLYLEDGRVYLAGPYRGARQSLVAAIPAVAGPFDLGSVFVRSSIRVDPSTARITLRSDPLPTMLHGIPLAVRDLRLELDRPGFIRAPTDCSPQVVEGSVRGADGANAGVTDRFQVGGCSKLRFRPGLALRFRGPTHRSGHPRLRAVFTTSAGEANIQRAVLTLPATQSLATRHVRGVCEPSQHRAGACPASSVYGYAEAWSPLLDDPLRGPVYLRSAKSRLPALVLSLEGATHLDLVAHLDAVDGRLRATFGSVPDVPLRKLALTLHGGSRGLLVNNAGLCKRRPRVRARFLGQNAKRHRANPYVRVPCGKDDG